MNETSINKIKALGILKGEEGSSKNIISYIENIISQQFEEILMRELLTAIGFDGDSALYGNQAKDPAPPKRYIPTNNESLLLNDEEVYDTGVDLGDSYDYGSEQEEEEVSYPQGFNAPKQVKELSGDFDPENETLVIDPTTESEGTARDEMPTSVGIDSILTEINPSRKEELLKVKQSAENHDFLQRMGINLDSVSPRVIGRKVAPNMGKGNVQAYSSNSSEV